MTQPPPPAGWYPDPEGTGGSRWWTGQAWTGDVRPPAPRPPLPLPRQETSTPGALATRAAQAPARQVPVQQGAAHRAGMRPRAETPPPAASLYEQPVLVVSQRTELAELTDEYAVYDAQGRQVGAVVEVGRSGVRRALRFVSRLDQFLAHRLEVRDAGGVVLVLTRPAKVLRSRVLVARADGSPVGEIVQANVFGTIRFDLVAGGRPVGALRAENRRAWNFAITDASGTEVARITKTWEGLATTLFTTADSYVVHVPVRLPDPLAGLVIAAALTVGTAVEQDDRGSN